MVRCQHCIYWGHPQHTAKVRQCDMIGWGDTDSTDDAFIDANASDDSGMFANFMTRATFGCAMGKTKFSVGKLYQSNGNPTNWYRIDVIRGGIADVTWVLDGVDQFAYTNIDLNTFDLSTEKEA